MLSVHQKNNSKVRRVIRGRGKGCWADKSYSCPSVTLHDTKGIQPWSWHTVGLLGWKIRLLFLGRSWRTSFIIKELGQCTQLKGLCGCSPGLLPGWANWKRPLGGSPCRPHYLGQRSLSVCWELWVRVWSLQTPRSLRHRAPSWASRSCPLCYPWSLWAVRHGLTRGWGGPLLGTQTPVGHPVASEQGSPQQNSIRFPKTRLGPPGMQHSSLLLAAANLC